MMGTQRHHAVVEPADPQAGSTAAPHRRLVAVTDPPDDAAPDTAGDRVPDDTDDAVPRRASRSGTTIGAPSTPTNTAEAGSPVLRQLIFDDISRHIGVARRLGIEPLTVVERANEMLDAACEGWLTERRCRAADGHTLDIPHSRCLRAQYQHDVFLVEHGLLNLERTGR